MTTHELIDNLLACDREVNCQNLEVRINQHASDIVPINKVELSEGKKYVNLEITDHSTRENIGTIKMPDGAAVYITSEDYFPRLGPLEIIIPYFWVTKECWTERFKWVIKKAIEKEYVYLLVDGNVDGKPHVTTICVGSWYEFDQVVNTIEKLLGI